MFLMKISRFLEDRPKILLEFCVGQLGLLLQVRWFVGGFKSRNLFLIVLEVGGPASVSGEGLFLVCLQTAAFLLCPCMVERERPHFSSF